MRLIKRKSTNGQTWEDDEGKKHPYYNYFLELDNGKRICVRACFSQDTAKLDLVAVYEG